MDRSGGPTNNNIYMVASVQPFSGGGTNVMFARSIDGGASFSAPVRINDDPGQFQQMAWFGTSELRPMVELILYGWTPKCREQPRFAAILLVHHRWRRYLGAERSRQQFL